MFISKYYTRLAFYYKITERISKMIFKFPLARFCNLLENSKNLFFQFISVTVTSLGLLCCVHGKNTKSEIFRIRYRCYQCPGIGDFALNRGK